MIFKDNFFFEGDSVLIAVELNNKWKNYKMSLIERKIRRHERRMIVKKKILT